MRDLTEEDKLKLKDVHMITSDFIKKNLTTCSENVKDRAIYIACRRTSSDDFLVFDVQDKSQLNVKISKEQAEKTTFGIKMLDRIEKVQKTIPLGKFFSQEDTDKFWNGILENAFSILDDIEKQSKDPSKQLQKQEIFSQNVDQQSGAKNI